MRIYQSRCISTLWRDAIETYWIFSGSPGEPGFIVIFWRDTIATIFHGATVAPDSLSQICKEAWDIIVPTFEDTINLSADEDGTEKVPNGTIFAEGLLRNVLDLTSEQQLELSNLVAR